MLATARNRVESSHSYVFTNPGAMQSDSWRVVCQDHEDGSGDVIVELPSELLEKLGWNLGDGLAIENGEVGISLKLQQRAVNAPP